MPVKVRLLSVLPVATGGGKVVDERYSKPWLAEQTLNLSRSLKLWSQRMIG